MSPVDLLRCGRAAEDGLNVRPLGPGGNVELGAGRCPGLTLIQMAIAFVTRHAAVTSAIFGPRTTEHLESYLAADEIDLSGDLLDRIDEIVPPAVTLNVADNMWMSPALRAAARRR
jgi:hypothetical protein